MDRPLRTDAEIDAAADALVAEWPALTDEQVARLAVILAPIAEARRNRQSPDQPGAA